MRKYSAVVHINSLIYEKEQDEFGKVSWTPQSVDNDGFVLLLESEDLYSCTQEIKDKFEEIRNSWPIVTALTDQTKE